MKKRVKIPRHDSTKLLALVKKMRAKHVADGEASPLKVLNWTEVDVLIDDALATEDRAHRLRREKLLAFQHRRIQLNRIVSLVRSSRDILTGVHSDEMKMLGLWGYDVLDNRSAAPPESETDVTNA